MKHPFGVVIGSYGLPHMVDLQIKLLRYHNGTDFPILVVDDHSPRHVRDKQLNAWWLLQQFCNSPGVELMQNSFEKHAGQEEGDLAVFRIGIQWAFEKELSVLVKVSQRWLVDKPDWLRSYAGKLTRHKTAVMASNYFDKWPDGSVDGIRTDVCMLWVNWWMQPSVYSLIKSYQDREVEDTFLKIVGDRLMRWDLHQFRLLHHASVSSKWLVGPRDYGPFDNKNYPNRAIRQYARIALKVGAQIPRRLFDKTNQCWTNIKDGLEWRSMPHPVPMTKEEMQKLT